MRILYCANNLVGLQILSFLKSQGEEVVGLILHPQHEQKYVEEMKALVRLPDAAHFCGTKLNHQNTLDAVRELKPDMCLSVLFGFLFKNPYFDLFPKGLINLHPSLLPFNRGQYPNIWSIVDRTPAGVTLHTIDAGIDSGDIIAQKEVFKTPSDTGESLYRKIEKASVELFEESWECLKAGSYQPQHQSKEEGSFYRTKDVEKIREFNLDREYVARELIDRIRALTFPPHLGATFKEAGKTYQVRISIEEVKESEDWDPED